MDQKNTWFLQLIIIWFFIIMNSSLEVLVQNLLDNDFKYLSQEFSSDLLELVKQKGVYLYEHEDSFKKLFDKKLPDSCGFFCSLKDECMNEKDYLHAIDFLSVFKMNAIGDFS